jgi:uncharacterized protein YbjT (DUF2867 family)
MATKKTIAVIGATGAQGGGLAHAIMNDSDGPFHVRAVTRNIRSDKATGLAQRGAELVEADLDDVESLKRAFRGAYGAYCVTNYWEYLSPERELAQATNAAEAARDAGLEHVIWSTFEDTRDWVSLDDDHAHAHGEVQGAALRRQGRGQSGVHRPRGADHVPPDVVLLGQLHLIRNGSAAGPGRRAGHHDAHG